MSFKTGLSKAGNMFWYFRDARGNSLEREHDLFRINVC